MNWPAFRRGLTLAFGLIPSLLAQGGSAVPSITAIVNAASYVGSAVSPGEMVTIFGSQMGPDVLVGLQLDTAGRVATQLAGTRVLFDGTPAPLIYTSARQLTAMVPYSTLGQSTTVVQVEYNGNRSATFAVRVAASFPGIFAADASGRGQAAAVNENGTPNSSSNRAQAGSVISLYATGEGQTVPPGVDGQIATDTLPGPASSVRVQIGGIDAPVQYKGTAPNSVAGFLQVNAQIPLEVLSGDAIAVTITIGSATSQANITVAITGGAGVSPTAPGNLQAVAMSTSQVNLSWTNTASNATSIRIERKIATGTYVEIASASPVANSYQDTGLGPSTAYSYRVRVQVPSGFSAYSNEATVTTPVALPSAPSNLQAVAVSSTQINLTWTNPSATFVRVHIERKNGAMSYAEVGTGLPSAISYQDAGLTPSVSYSYRIRVEAASGFSPYSNESTATTATVVGPPTNLQATAVSQNQINLSWVNPAISFIRIHVERKAGPSGAYAEVATTLPTTNVYQDAGLTASSNYAYRIRTEASGLSNYSNEATTSTFPATPTSLRTTAVSPTQVNLTWTNNAPDAIAIRIEYRPPGSSAFAEVSGPAVTLANSGVTGLQPNTTYAFRVRAQNGAGFSPYSNEASVTTLPLITTVFLIHGINQGSAEMQSLAFNLGDPISPDQIDLTRFSVDAGFDWHICANNPSCSSNCTIPNGAAALANYIAGASPQGANVVLVGYSLGGLLAREAVLSYPGVFAGRRVVALITLGTPSQGYPWASIDDSARCPTLVHQMQSDFQGGANPNIPRVESAYLIDLNQRWGASSPGSRPANWLAMAGTFCTSPTRSIFNPVGCSDHYPSSDGVVCQTSAWFSMGAASNLPTDSWSDSTFAHSEETILCTTQRFFNYYNVLYKPPMGSSLLKKIRDAINGL
jgi:uncharacterized protein (TIGR03437 family)